MDYVLLSMSRRPTSDDEEQTNKQQKLVYVTLCLAFVAVPFILLSIFDFSGRSSSSSPPTSTAARAKRN